MHEIANGFVFDRAGQATSVHAEEASNFARKIAKSGSSADALRKWTGPKEPEIFLFYISRYDLKTAGWTLGYVSGVDSRPIEEVSFD